MCYVLGSIQIPMGSKNIATSQGNHMHRVRLVCSLLSTVITNSVFSEGCTSTGQK